jgi:hypothetical protein
MVNREALGMSASCPNDERRVCQYLSPVEGYRIALLTENGAALCLHIKPRKKDLQRISREAERDRPLLCC